jgi:hypothetical protein
VKSSLDYRVGEGKWQAIDLNSAMDRRNLASDGKPDLRLSAGFKPKR